VDLWRLFKAATVDLRSSEYTQGASTLTQQYVKNTFLTPEKRFKRKFEEICISLILETRLTKRQIFELYANEIYLGQRGPYSITGFGEAAAVYFHKSLRELTLSEAAFLAGILPAPNRFNPYRNGEKALKQRNRVLDAMEENSFITLNEKLAAKSETLRFKPEITYDYLEAPYFVNYVESRLAGRFSREELYKKSYRIYTSLHPDLQQAAHEAIQEVGAAVDKLVARKKSSGKPQMALVAIDPRSGEILAMVGGRNFGQSQYNRVIEAHRQPGSSFKPFVYAAALETPFTDSMIKITPAKTYVDEPVTFTFGNQTYTPKSLSGKYLGLVNLRQALMLSLNVPTVELAQEIGYDQVVKLARKCGFDENVKPYPSIALGAFEVTPLEIAQAYCVFPKLGRFQRAHGIYRIESSTGAYKEDVPPAVPVIHPETAYLVTSLMQSVLDRGTGARARQLGFDLPAAGKTGSSNDGWFIGFTPDLLCATWVGFDDNRDTTNLLGANSALPIWTAFMKRAKEVLPLSGAGFPRPQNIVTVDIDPDTGLLATAACGKVSAENFVAGTEPTTFCQVDHATLTLTSETKTTEADKEKKPGILKKLLGVFN
jgi:penicillin-binding protein 1B